MNFNPADVQEWGIGISAFLAALFAVLIFVSDARGDRTARSFGEMMLAIAFWAGFGLLFQVTANLQLAREFRVLSVLGIVWIMFGGMRFAYNYLSTARAPRGVETAVKRALLWIGLALSAIIVSDLFWTRIVVGDLPLPPWEILAPHAGPLLPLVILYHVACMVCIAWFFSEYLRAIRSNDAERRRSSIVAVSLLSTFALGLPRYTEWYGFEFFALVTGIAVPLQVITMFYAMRKYNLFNVRVIGAQLVVFTLWTFTFFRLLLDTSARDTLPDLVLFIIVLILGVLLLRSVFMEAKTQREFAVLAVDHAKSEFVTIAAHELRTPLSAVRWAFGLLLSDQDHPLSPEQRDILMKGNKAADRMMDLSNDFLNIAHMAEGKFTFDLEPGDIRTAARVALEAFEDPAKQKNISLSIECSESMPSVTFDRSKLTMAIENLIDNAIKYTPQNGAVLLRVCHDDKTASIAVSDTGIGISPDELEHSFEKFFRGKRAVQMFTDGSGLGLFITKTIVEGHGGTISIGAHEGGGTTITIALPVARYWSRNVS